MCDPRIPRFFWRGIGLSPDRLLTRVLPGVILAAVPHVLLTGRALAGADRLPSATTAIFLRIGAATVIAGCVGRLIGGL